MPDFELYQRVKNRYQLDRELATQVIQRCQSFAIETLSVFAKPHLWREALPVYPILTRPEDNGGWGHLLPVWFKPAERPVPFYLLENWALFAEFYRESFGRSREALKLADSVFTMRNLAQVVIGSNILLPFLPSTQGTGLFFRHGMLPCLLAILWLDEKDRQAWLRLHEIGAERFIASHDLGQYTDLATHLQDFEFMMFSRLERNNITDDESVAGLLLNRDGQDGRQRLLRLYQSLFGAIDFGVAALARSYRERPLEAWRDWAYQEFSYSYRMADYGVQAMKDLIGISHEP